MHPVLEDLITLLRLERIEQNIFRGDSRDIGNTLRMLFDLLHTQPV